MVATPQSAILTTTRKTLYIREDWPTLRQARRRSVGMLAVSGKVSCPVEVRSVSCALARVCFKSGIYDTAMLADSPGFTEKPSHASTLNPFAEQLAPLMPTVSTTSGRFPLFETCTSLSRGVGTSASLTQLSPLSSTSATLPKPNDSLVTLKSSTSPFSPVEVNCRSPEAPTPETSKQSTTFTVFLTQMCALYLPSSLGAK
mmetsp:Transcript_1321/g.4442  ORF Transcript_1321/g.4442 Transcript_1321/m.4442 type:complete len:201 (+) Transcript_1321:1545-2147(+)